MTTLLIIGPDDVASPGGGVTLPFKEFCEDAVQGATAAVRVSRYGRSLRKLFRLIVEIFRLPPGSTVVLHATWTAVLVIAPLLVLTARLRRHRLVLRKFAGDCDLRYAALSSLGARVVSVTLKRFDLLYFETRYLVDWARSHSWNARWWPNSRRLPDRGCRVPRNSIANAKAIFLGRVCRAKGVFKLPEFAIDDEGSIEVDVWGPVDESDAAEIERFIQSHPQCLTYRGVLKREQVATVLMEYDLLLLPTSWVSEGYPGVIIEAAMVGVPAAVSCSRGPSELVSLLGYGVITSDDRLPRRTNWKLSPEQSRELAAYARENFSSSRIHGRIIEEIRSISD